MDSVSDIVALPHLDDSAVQEGVITSKKKRDDTVQKLNEFDYSQTVSLNPVEQDIQTMETWLKDIEGMFQSGLTDVHFQPSRWGILASRNTLKMELEARQTLSVSFHNQYNWNTDKLLSILEYKRPILFGFSGFINRESPFISPDLIVISNIKKETSLNKSFESGGVFVANVSNKVTAGTHENLLFPLMQAFDSDKNPTEVWRDLFAGNLNDGESTYNLPKNNSKVVQTIADTLGYTIGGIGLTKALRGAGLGMKTGLPFLSKGRILSATKEGAMVGTVMASTEIAGREIGRPKDYNWKENTIQFGMEVVGGAVLDPLIDTALPLIKSTSSNPAKKLLNNQPVISHSSSSKIETVGEVDKGSGIETYQHLKDYKNNKYFTRSVEYNVGKEGTGFTYKVYQRGDINWDMVRIKGAKKGRGLTNAEASAKYGLAPILDDAGSVATLHHSQQKGVRPLYEASTRYHNIRNAKRAPLHPYKGKLNPFYPMDETIRGAFQKVDSINYWKIRGEESLGGK